ncbi:acyl-CoA dehydrogenase [Nocardia terpenica]|uniref:acyl-CoA dehydrogenase n=1 Tax=Nocardia terpenica TaxID=455432 RepID=UPI001895CA97|nr:acyl-CoA dehydrogenase [Nocardia terpenica]MBF6059982.1 acyl-CoA dehydrogenase [Nocardia terpenica]MBF6102477.1 acyl-CoA dehydrogenase [Nocardia terpenica]MBF6111332.1 acyl-CoA dehydrogenase [Nocardia terpenica]MBF6117463.1 acyl-CoA dehydrogenase [Nocardia terpenica]MBF6150696.1 acyl-CoA dehydrogenase [Nocardia terpenica]
MGHYKSNVRDLEFTLFEVLGLAAILGSGAFGDLDEPTVRSMLAEAAALAEGPVAESFADGDRHPPVFDPVTHSVRLPESVKRSVRAWRDGEWWRVGKSEAIGGVPAPRMVAWAISEFVLGAQPAAYLYLTGPIMADVVDGLGTAEQRRWARLAMQRNWGTTMALTEPDAGSDVGAGRTKAVAQQDGSWHIEGVKRFITSGESDDLFENIVHQVLARPEGAAAGTKGLSLFLVPKFRFDTVTGDIGERNGVFVTGVEHKMGLKASATCELTFGAHGTPAVGYLVGEVHDGIAQMFRVIEHARMMVGTKAISTLSSGYLNALDYARTRVQGSDLTRMADKTAPRVTIAHHPDVRRSLMLQKSYAEGLRAVYLYTAAHQDAVAAQRVSGADAELAARVNDLLLPVVKGVGSERAYQYLTESLQCFGGSGFLQDYPIEQYIRDSKIDSLYEGTTAIQAQDFFFRKIARDRGVALRHLIRQIGAFIAAPTDGGRLAFDKSLLATALDDVQAMVGTLTGHLAAAEERPTELYKIGLAAVPLLLSVGDLLIGWRLLVAADIARTALDSAPDDQDRAFYQGKIAAASFFARTVLPRLSADRAALSGLDATLMNLDEAAF